MENLDKDRLAKLLKNAELAHAEYEKSIGKADPNWPEWYAEYILEQLSKS